MKAMGDAMGVDVHPNFRGGSSYSIGRVRRGLPKPAPGLPKRRGLSPMIPTYTTPVFLPKLCLAFGWPTQMKIPRTAPFARGCS